jgi:sec-independent protein translocase protein TatC
MTHSPPDKSEDIDDSSPSPEASSSITPSRPPLDQRVNEISSRTPLGPNSKTKNSSSESKSNMTFFDHLRDLRRIILRVLLIVISGACLSYYYAEDLFKLLSEPFFQYFPANSLIGTGPAEAFVLKIKIAIFSGFILTSPLTFFQLWLFISPGLYEKERKLALPFVLVASTLFISGCYLCYKLILPFTFGFFKEQYDSIGITPQIRVSEHLSLLIFALISFGAMFELPVVTFILAKLGIVTHKMLLAWWRYAVVVIFILAAVITPTPDVLTMTLFACPMLILYGISIGVAWAVGAGRLDGAVK